MTQTMDLDRGAPTMNAMECPYCADASITRGAQTKRVRARLEPLALRERSDLGLRSRAVTLLKSLGFSRWGGNPEAEAPFLKSLGRLAHNRIYALVCFLAFGLQTLPGHAQPPLEAPKTNSQATERDGQHDFDFELGAWKIHLKRLVKPLTGSTTWVEFDGTSVTRKVWGGRANLEEFKTVGPTGPVEGVTLRLYNPESREWSIYWANRNNGILGVPTIGKFKNGRGEFYDQEQYNGRTIFVRYVWSDITPTSAHFEQSFSEDGGKTWEVNWITDQTRVSEAPLPEVAPAASKTVKTAPQQTAKGRDGQRDFDFNVGTWKTHLRRLRHPLTGSTEWVEYEGTSVVGKVWDGNASLVELDAKGPAGQVEALSLRLYNSESRQWSLNFSNPRSGTLSPPSVGEFKNGRGEFYSQETFNGRTILVRFVITEVTHDSWRFEQAFSDDGGKTWEFNWIATDTRVKQ